MKYLKKFESIQQNHFISVEERYPEENDGECFLLKLPNGDIKFAIKEIYFYIEGFFKTCDNFTHWMSIDYIIEEINNYFLYIGDNYGSDFKNLKLIIFDRLKICYSGIYIRLHQKEEFLNYCFKLNKLLFKLYNCQISVEIKDDDGWYKNRRLENLSEIIKNPNFEYKISMSVDLYVESLGF